MKDKEVKMKTVYIITTLLLMAAAIEDIKKKEISRVLLAGIGISCSWGCCLMNNRNWWEIIGGFTIGLCVIGISIISAEQIGKGDGMVIAALGLLLGARNCFFMIGIASILMTMLSIVILTLKKAGRHTKIPFIPAIFGGYAAVLVILS